MYNAHNISIFKWFDTVDIDNIFIFYYVNLLLRWVRSKKLVAVRFELFVLGGKYTAFVFHPFCILSCDRFIAPSKPTSQYSAIYCFLFQFPVSTLSVEVISSCLSLHPRLTVISIFPSIFPSIREGSFYARCDIEDSLPSSCCVCRIFFFSLILWIRKNINNFAK